MLTPLAVDPEPPVPVHLRPVAERRRDGATPRPASAASRGSRSRPAPPPRRPSTRSGSSGSRSSSSATSTTLFAGMVIEEAGAVPGHPQRRPHRRGGRRPTTSSKRSRWSCGGAGSTEAVRLEVADAISDEMLDLLVRELDLDENDVRAIGRRSTCAACGSCTHSTGPTSRTGRGRPSCRARIAKGIETDRPIVSVMRDRAIHGAPPVRELHHIDRGVHRAGGRRPAGAVDQDDAVPRRRRQPDHAQPDPRRRSGACRWRCSSS